MRFAIPLMLLVVSACKPDKPATAPSRPTLETATPASPDAGPVAQGPDCEGPVRHWAALVGGSSEENIAASIASCQSDGWSAATLDCLTAATDAAGAERCMRPLLAPDAAKQLLEMFKVAAGFAAAGEGFPVGSGAATPAKPCCDSADQLCHVTRADWKKGVWAKLGFYFDGASPFQMSYESAKPGEMVVRAVADLDCDGASIVWELRGTWNGSEDTYELSEPDLAAD